MSTATFEQIRRPWLDFIPKRGTRLPAAWAVGLLAAGSLALGGLGVASALSRGDAEGETAAPEPMLAAVSPDRQPEVLANGSGGTDDEQVEPRDENETATTGELDAKPAAETDPEGMAEVAKEPVPRESPSESRIQSRVRAEPKPLSQGQLRRARQAASGLRSALSAGIVHQTRTLFVTILDTEGVQWETAVEACAEASVDGVSRWRLPTVPELRELRAAKQVPRATYWSSTSSHRDPEAAYVYDTGRRHRGLYLKMEPTGAIVCVQHRPY